MTIIRTVSGVPNFSRFQRTDLNIVRTCINVASDSDIRPSFSRQRVLLIDTLATFLLPDIGANANIEVIYSWSY